MVDADVSRSTTDATLDAANPAIGPHPSTPDVPNPIALLSAARRPVFFHAHPDDETLATGALILDLAGHAQVGLVTATRGERGEVVAGPLAVLAGTPTLAAHRHTELVNACAALGVATRAYLGEPPARAAGQPPRWYRDSGMRWVTPDLAGPSDDAGPDALTAAPVAEAAADLAAFLAHVGADALVSYDADGGYGHPDHVACHRIALAASALAGVRFVAVVSPTRRDEADPRQGVWRLAEHTGRLRQALACYPSQFTLEGDAVVHSGGQRQPIVADVVLESLPGDGSLT